MLYRKTFKVSSAHKKNLKIHFGLTQDTFFFPNLHFKHLFSHSTVLITVVIFAQKLMKSSPFMFMSQLSPFPHKSNSLTSSQSHFPTPSQLTSVGELTGRMMILFLPPRALLVFWSITQRKTSPLWCQCFCCPPSLHFPVSLFPLLSSFSDSVLLAGTGNLFL